MKNPLTKVSHLTFIQDVITTGNDAYLRSVFLRRPKDSVDEWYNDIVL